MAASQRPKPRRSRATRPLAESLEGRALMAASLFDPTFGRNGIALGPSGSTTQLNAPSAIAVQADGKVVVAGVSGKELSSPLSTPYTLLAVERYNADGTLDTSFGTNGQFDVPLPAGASGVNSGNVIVGNDGTITLAASVTAADGFGVQGLVVRLTAAGALDPTFGTGGEFATAVGAVGLSALAAQQDGTLVAAGWGNSTVQVVRLTAAGVPDTSFNTTGTVVVPLTSPGVYLTSLYGGGLAVTAAGQIYVASNELVSIGKNSVPATALTRINSDGTPDSTYGTSGTRTPDGLGYIGDIAVQPSGDLLVAGGTSPYSGYPKFVSRYLPSGQLDTTFGGTDPGSRPQFIGARFNSMTLGADGSITVAGSLSRNNNLNNTLGVVVRLTADGYLDPTFGANGFYSYMLYPPGGYTFGVRGGANDAAVAPNGDIIVAGQLNATTRSGPLDSSQSYVAALRPATSTSPSNQSVAGDYNGDGKSDVAVYLTASGTFDISPSTDLTSGGPAPYLVPFGSAGPGASIPVAGDFDGDGKADIAVYLPALGAFAVSPSGGAPAQLTAFGSAGAGASIPVPGDYDGDGKTDLAVYLPALGAFAVKPSDGAPAYLFAFGSAGAGASIPVAGDFDGDGRTDFAVYLPATGQFAVKPSDGAPAYLFAFGSAGAGASIPAVGDYDGDGRSDFAVYLPALGSFAVAPSGGSSAYLAPFGGPGAGASIPAPGDYDGDGRADLAVYLPTAGLYASRPSGGGIADSVQSFGSAGPGQSIPPVSLPMPPAVTAKSFAGISPARSDNYLVALDVDLTTPTTANANKKSKG